VRVNNRHYRTIWLHPDDPRLVRIIDQRHLPFEFVVEDVADSVSMARAISEMRVRGAGLIGAAAGFGMYLAALENQGIRSPEGFTRAVTEAGARLKATRPTAVNLEWAVERQLGAMAPVGSVAEKIAAAMATAQRIADEDAEYCRRIGEHGARVISDLHRRTGRPVNVLTHCNAGWLAFVDHGSATAPIYAAHDSGVPVHVWVDETRPRNQGARLTAWELSQHGVDHTVVADNAGGHLMQHGQVDLVLTGADRVTRSGDAANKVGTYLKALAARDNGVPFYVALPSSTFDWRMRDGVREIPIEERGGDEVTFISGLDSDGRVRDVRLTPIGSRAANFAFDVTPARLVTGLVTERGICSADEEGILGLFPERRPLPSRDSS
jgi:methylthioribose-1-phosphate isomerase